AAGSERRPVPSRRPRRAGLGEGSRTSTPLRPVGPGGDHARQSRSWHTQSELSPACPSRGEALSATRTSLTALGGTSSPRLRAQTASLPFSRTPRHSSDTVTITMAGAILAAPLHAIARPALRRCRLARPRRGDPPRRRSSSGQRPARLGRAGVPGTARSVGFGGDGRLSRKRAVGSFGVAVVGTVAGEVGETFVAMHEVVGDQSPSK